MVDGPELEGQIAIVTGGARAIGRAIAETLGRRGATVVSVDLAPSDDTVAAIEAAGARLLYLPPYSPEFNPIELAFAKLKALLRSAAARTVSDLWAAIHKAFTRFSPEECRNYFAAAGYEDDACASS